MKLIYNNELKQFSIELDRYFGIQRGGVTSDKRIVLMNYIRTLPNYDQSITFNLSLEGTPINLNNITNQSELNLINNAITRLERGRNYLLILNNDISDYILVDTSRHTNRRSTVSRIRRSNQHPGGSRLEYRFDYKSVTRCGTVPPNTEFYIITNSTLVGIPRIN